MTKLWFLSLQVIPPYDCNPHASVMGCVIMKAPGMFLIWGHTFYVSKRTTDHSLWVSTILSFSGALVRLTGVFPWRMAAGPGLCNSGQEAPARAYLRPPGKWERGHNLAGSFILLSFFSSILKCGEMCSLTIAANCKKYCRPANHPAKPAIIP